MNAASSRISNDKPSERAASSEDVSATTCEPFLYLRESLLSSIHVDFNHVGRLACITRTLVTKLRAFYCFVAITKIFLSVWKVINHKEYPATSVDSPSCLAFKMML